MSRNIPIFIIALAMAAAVIGSCVHKPQIQPTYGNFPAAVGRIMITKCAVAGCHNAASYKNSDGLLLDSWEHLFQGGVSGAEVVAFSTEFSPLLYFCNTDSSLGTVALPTMPVSTSTLPQKPLTRAEYDTLVNWIANGAPDANGNIPFASNPATRQKIYVTQQGCDLLAVIDAQSRLIMRYIPLQATPDGSVAASPHDVEVSSDGMYAYVPFIEGEYLDKINTTTDKIESYANIGVTAGQGQQFTGSGWSIVKLSPLDTSLMVTGYYANSVVNINTASLVYNQAMCIDAKSGFPPSPWAYPHGIENNATFDTFVTCMQWGNAIAKFSFQPNQIKKLYYKFIGVNGLTAKSTDTSDHTSPDPHQVQMSPDHSKYFVTCQGNATVVVFNAYNDSIIKTINVGGMPQEMDISESKGYLFVACLQDNGNPNTGALGSVYVIDYNTLSIVKVLYGDFYQPHDIAVDEQNGMIYVISTNYSSSGPPPHHVTGCGPRAGWYTVYDLNTLTPADNKRYQMTYYPYACSARF